MDDKLKNISTQLHQLAVELDSVIESRPTELELVEEGARVPPEPSVLDPFPDEDIQSNNIGQSFTIPDGNPNIVDEVTDKADEMGVEGVYTFCPKCLKPDYLVDNRDKKQEVNHILSQGTAGMDQEQIDKLEKTARIPVMSCSSYKNDNNCDWATWDLDKNPPLGSELWMEKRLEEYNA